MPFVISQDGITEKIQLTFLMLNIQCNTFYIVCSQTGFVFMNGTFLLDVKLICIL